MDKETLAEIVQAVMARLNAPEEHLPTITRDLEEAGIEYAVVGGLALRFHNVLRQARSIDILVSQSSYPRIAKELVGRGYSPRPGSGRNLSYDRTGLAIPINLHVEGEIVNNHEVPSPLTIRMRRYGRWYCTLEFLVESKIRSGTSADVSDLTELIRENDLKQAFADRLNPSVRGTFVELVVGD